MAKGVSRLAIVAAAVVIAELSARVTYSPTWSRRASCEKVSEPSRSRG